MILMLLSRLALADVPCTPADIGELTQQAAVQLRDEDFAGALHTIQQAETSLPCADQHIWPYQLSMLYQTRAAAVARLEGEEAALLWYGHAARMAPSVPFDPTLYPAGRRQFSAALDASRQLPGVVVSAPSGAILDGVFVPPGGSRQVPQGLHVVQHLSAGGALVTELVALQDDVQIGPAVEEARRLPLLVAGAGLAVVGGALLGSSAYWQRRAGEYAVAGHEEAESVQRSANLLTGVGIGAVVAGTGVLVGATLLDDGPALLLTWSR